MAESRRMQLQHELINVLGSKNVYFQPSESVKMKYPAIVYHFDNAKTRYANDKAYFSMRKYTVTAIDKNPDTEWDKTILQHFEYCRMDRIFVADNLNHWVFTLYW